MKKPYHIVFTTIFHPKVLEHLHKNISRHGHLGKTKVWVVGDKKTPKSVRTLAEKVTAQGLEIVYLDIPWQKEWGKRHPEFYSRIPYNNETRRNIGYLAALEDGCEVLISIDDDNFPLQKGDFVGGHMKTGRPWKGKVIHEDKGFHNICEYIVVKPNRHIFPRGFPFHQRGMYNQAKIKKATARTKIGVTAGLWLVEPDIDATTWLHGKVLGTRYKGNRTHVLAQNTWTPINTQNTSVARELIPAYLCIPMGWDVPGGKIQRYGDIWGGYFLQALIKNTNHHIAFGHPLVEHHRNPHNYVDDLRHEFWGMMLTDWLLGVLKDDFKPKKKKIIDRIPELADFIDKAAKKTLPAWCPPEMKEFLHHTAENLREWGKVCKIVINKSA